MTKPGKKNVPNEQAMGPETMAGSDSTGAYLRKLRTDRGLSVKDACEATRISETNLKAIENQDFTTLPADIFTRGLLKIYVQFLEADPAQVIARFMQERDENQAEGKRYKTKPTSRRILTPKKLAEPAHISSITMAGGLLLFIVILFTGFGLYTSWNPFSFLALESGTFQAVVRQALPGKSTTTSTPPKNSSNAGPAPTPATESPQQSIAASAAGHQELAGQETPTTTTPPLAATAGVKSVSVVFLKDTRLVITRDNEQPVSTLFKKGEKQSWSDAASLRLSFDQPESATILVDNQPVAFPPGAGGLYTLRLPADLPLTPAQ